MSASMSRFRMTSFFRDQVSCVSDCFVSWNECEQVVTLYSLLRKINSTQAKFLAQVLEHILQNCNDCDAQENYANDPAYISSLFKESKDVAVLQLLKCLPLLKVGNVKAKAEYLNIMPMIMAHSVENGCHIEECRQLLSYSLIHPAISRDELAVLTFWMNSLEECSSRQRAKSPPKPVSSQNVLSSQYGCTDELADPALLVTSIANKSSLQTMANGVPARYIVGTLAEASCVGSDWPAMTSCGNGKGDVGSLGSNHAHPAVINVRNRTLTASASLPLTDNVSHPFINWDTGGHVHPPQLSNQTPYPAFPSSQAVGARKTDGHQKLTRTASLMPPAPNVVTPSVSEWLSDIHNDHMEGIGNHRLMSPFVNADQLHAPLSPQSSITSSGSGGSDTHGDDLHRTHAGAASREDPAMKDVSVWLKSLRLHKYSHLFQQITYDEMMNLSEDWLEAQGVTKGARNKIIISIRKLKERQDTLRTMEKDVMSNGSLKQAIADLRQMLSAPIKQHTSTTTSSSTSSDVAAADETPCNSTAFAADSGGSVSSISSSSSDHLNPISETDSIAEGDIPGQMTRVLGKICTQLLVKIRPDCDCLISYQQLLDRCINHHAFTDEQRKKMASWRQQIHRVWQFLLQKQNDHHRPNFNPGVPSNASLRGSHNRPVRRPPGPSWTFGGAAASGSSRSHIGAPHHLVHPVLSPQASAPHCQNPSSYTSGFPPRIPIEVSPVKQPLGRTQSAPIKTVPLTMPLVSAPVAETPENCSTNEDIHASLDSLCISMMEHALGN